ncbi:MAG TPA: hypothetical protein VIL49_07000 [Capillimicrobium sp.]|jgi:hypothetical protein
MAQTRSTRPRPTATRRPTKTTRSAPRGFRPATTVRRRSQPKPSGIQGLIGKAVPGLLGGTAAKKSATSAARKPAGMAMLAGAAGLAFKNRDKLGSMLGRKKSDEHADHVVAPVAADPYSPASVATPSSPGTGTPSA